MKPNDKNLTGVESFDHSSLRHLPEYHKARKALNDLIHAINDHDEIELGQAGFLKVIEQMGSSLAYADSSGHDRNTDCHWQYHLAWPYRAVVEKGWLRGWYRCAECGEEWTCGYAVNFPMFF